MSRFKRTTNRGNWSSKDMGKGIEAVMKGMKIREAAERYGVPKSTLNERVIAKRNGLTVKLEPKLGRYDTIFTKEQEEVLKR